MGIPKPRVKPLMDKIRALPLEKVVEVEDFVDLLKNRAEDRDLVRATARLTEKSLRRVWDNPDDAVYDKL